MKSKFALSLIEISKVVLVAIGVWWVAGKKFKIFFYGVLNVFEYVRDQQWMGCGDYLKFSNLCWLNPWMWFYW